MLTYGDYECGRIIRKEVTDKEVITLWHKIDDMLTEMTDEEFNRIVKIIQDDTEYCSNAKSANGAIMFVDGFQASVSYNESSKQYEFYEEWPARYLRPTIITKEQARVLKKELKKLVKVRGY